MVFGLRIFRLFPKNWRLILLPVGPVQQFLVQYLHFNSVHGKRLILKTYIYIVHNERTTTTQVSVHFMYCTFVLCYFSCFDFVIFVPLKDWCSFYIKYILKYNRCFLKNVNNQIKTHYYMIYMLEYKAMFFFNKGVQINFVYVEMLGNISQSPNIPFNFLTTKKLSSKNWKQFVGILCRKFLDCTHNFMNIKMIRIA